MPIEESWLKPVLDRSVQGKCKLAFDIGANRGDFTEWMLEKFERVVAVDADSRAVDILTNTFRGNSPVSVEYAAVCGPSQGPTATLFKRDNALQSSMLQEHPLGHGEIVGQKVVSTITLDRLIEKYGQPDLIKIDVEGFEAEVLSGLTAGMCNETRFIVEVHDRKKEVSEQLKRLGYDDCVLIPHPNPHEADRHCWLYLTGKNKKQDREAVKQDVQQAAESEVTITAEEVERISPANLLPVEKQFSENYERLMSAGQAAAKKRSCVFVGLARDIEAVLSTNIKRIEELGEMFREYRVVIVENDSKDFTKEILRDWVASNPNVTIDTTNNGRPHLIGFEDDRFIALAEYRNIAHGLASAYSHFDYVVVLDTDVWGGYEGLETGVAYHEATPTAGFYGSVSIAESTNGDLMHYDQFAFREFSFKTRWDKHFPFWLPPAGTRPVEVKSCFGGMAIYKMEAFMESRYSGGDCEHVPFHKGMSERGFRGFINPSQRVSIMSWKAAVDAQKKESSNMHGDICSDVV
jgi:FkbM family methyltransferase